MLAPGSTYTSAGRLNATLTLGPTVSYIAQGIAYDAAGNVLLDSTAVSGSNQYAKLARNATGAIFGTTSVNASDVIAGGLRISSTGQLVVVQGNPVVNENGNPLSTNGELCIA
jgi:hypothetical protein